MKTTNGPGAQVFRIYEVGQIVLVYKNEEFMLGIFSKVTPSFKYLNDGKKLAIIGLVSSYCSDDFRKKESRQILLALVVQSQISGKSTITKLNISV